MLSLYLGVSMQTVDIDLLPNPIFNAINHLYAEVSSPSEVTNLLIPEVYDSGFEDLFDILEAKVPWFKRKETTTMKLPVLNYEYNPKEIVVCVSGGKDSIATVLHYMQLGYKVYLYHLHGINKVYYDEYMSVEQIAKYLNLPYNIDSCKLSGQHSFTEHPLKNYIIANGAISWAINYRIAPNIAFGNFSQSRLDDMPFEVCGGDCLDMWLAYNKIISKIIPGFCIKLPLNNQKDTYDILDKQKELISLCQSCISPYRFKAHWKKRTEKKYGVQLMPNRCGCCWKDCVEYITLADMGMTSFAEWNEDYYLHCIEILGKTLQKESDLYEIPVTDIWAEYISHPIKFSRLKEKIENAIVRDGKIKYTK